jgi:nicotinamidase-related amidase
MWHPSFFIEAHQDYPGNVFESNPRLAQDLHLQGITQISAMGVQSDCCVRSSILGAIACGFDAQDITLLQGTHSTFDDASTGKSYSQIKKDVEEELAALGVQIKKWQRSKITDVWQGNENKRPCM